MAIKKVIIHAGMHKTGSSSIQETLFYNKIRLNENGYLYLTEWGSNQSGVLTNLFGHDSPQWARRYNIENHIDIAMIELFNESNTNILVNSVKHSNCETLIVSGEDICLFERNDVNYMKEYFYKHLGDVVFSIMFYVRNPVDYTASVYQQFMITPHFTNLKTEQNFKFSLEKFMDVFGKATCVYKFEDAIHHPLGLVGHFLESIGMPAAEIEKFRVIKSNESRSAEVVEILNEIEAKQPQILSAGIEGAKKGAKFDLLDDGNHYVANPLRKLYDIEPLFKVEGAKKGAKFDLPYNEKVRIQALAKEDSLWLKEKTGIDYSNYKIEEKEPPETYSRDTIESFISAFPLLTFPLKTIFLDFFRQKHLLTGDDKFRTLYAEGSVPWKIYHFSREVDNLLKLTPDLRDSDRMFYDNNRESTPANYAELFIDYGNGLALDQIVQIYPNAESRLRCAIKFDTKDNVKKFRLDPSLYASVIVLKDLRVNDKNDNYTLAYGNHDDCFGNMYVFFRDDPQLWFECSETVTSLFFELIVDTGSYGFSFCSKKWSAGMQQQLYALGHANSDLQQQLCALNNSNNELQQQLDEESGKNTALLNSTSWRLMQPLRTVMDWLRKIAGKSAPKS